MSSKRDVAHRLYESVIQNRESEWWTEEAYARRYSISESTIALKNLFDIFNEDWLKKTLDRWLNHKQQYHPLIEHLVTRGLYSLVILVELGKDVKDVKHLKKFNLLKKELRNPSKFISAWLELELAAHCLRKGYSLEFYPKIREKIPDLKLYFNEKKLYIEIKEIHPSEIEQTFLDISKILLPDISHILQQGISVEIILNNVPNETQIELLQEKISKQLMESKSKILKIGSLKAFIRTEKNGNSSFSVVPSKEIVVSELVRLGRSIKHKAKQIARTESGLIILDTGALQEYSTKKIMSAVEKIFLKYKLQNIIGVAIIRSYKFYKRKKESEVIMVTNTNYVGNISIRELSGILSFSRTRKLIP